MIKTVDVERRHVQAYGQVLCFGRPYGKDLAYCSLMYLSLFSHFFMFSFS